MTETNKLKKNGFLSVPSFVHGGIHSMTCIETDTAEDSGLYICTLVVALLHGIQNDTHTICLSVSRANAQKNTDTHTV